MSFIRRKNLIEKISLYLPMIFFKSFLVSVKITKVLEKQTNFFKKCLLFRRGHAIILGVWLLRCVRLLIHRVKLLTGIGLFTRSMSILDIGEGRIQNVKRKCSHQFTSI